MMKTLCETSSHVEVANDIDGVVFGGGMKGHTIDHVGDRNQTYASGAPLQDILTFRHLPDPF